MDIHVQNQIVKKTCFFLGNDLVFNIFQPFMGISPWCDEGPFCETTKFKWNKGFHPWADPWLLDSRRCNTSNAGGNAFFQSYPTWRSLAPRRYLIQGIKWASSHVDQTIFSKVSGPLVLSSIGITGIPSALEVRSGSKLFDLLCEWDRVDP